MRLKPRTDGGYDLNIAPQPGFQQNFLSSYADIVIGGGAAGAGKTTCLLFEGARNFDIRGFGAVIFRKTYPEIKMEGGLWDESKNLFPHFGARANEGKLTWQFKSGAKISFEHLSRESQLIDYQGSQITYLGFDELTHFTKKMFFYLLTRNRSMCGIKPYVRAVCNPDPDSWVAELIAWWIDQETGFPILSRAGVIRWFTIDKDQYVWGDTPADVMKKVPHLLDELVDMGMKPEDIIKSITFIPGTIYDNTALLKANPGYLANLKAQPEEIRMQLLEGNWKIRTDGLGLFEWAHVEDLFTNIVSERPDDKTYIIIDHAAFGKDFCVIGTWRGWRCIRIDVLYKSDTHKILEAVRNIRMKYRPIPVSNILIDQDGTKVQKALGCLLFQGNSASIAETKGQKKAIYKNLKTQCYYGLADRVNMGEVSIDPDEFYVDGVNQKYVFYKGKQVEIRTLIKEDLRAAKRAKVDYEGVTHMCSKEEHKNALGQRSPDFSDMMAQRKRMDFLRQPITMLRK